MKVNETFVETWILSTIWADISRSPRDPYLTLGIFWEAARVFEVENDIYLEADDMLQEEVVRNGPYGQLAGVKVVVNVRICGVEERRRHQLPCRPVVLRACVRLLLRRLLCHDIG